MSNTIADLRDHLFSTLDALRDKENPMEIERAKAISDVAQTIINTAKVEVDHMRVVGGAGSGFISASDSTPPTISNTSGGTKTVTQLGNGATLTRHRMS